MLQAASKWEEASKLFEVVIKEDPDNVDTGFIAKEEHAWCLLQLNHLQTAAEELQGVLDQLEQWDSYETRKARLWWRLGQCYWQMGGTYGLLFDRCQISYKTKQKTRANRHIVVLSQP